MASRKRDHAREEAGRRTERVTLRLSPASIEALDFVAGCYGQDRSGMVRMLVVAQAALWKTHQGS